MIEHHGPDEHSPIEHVYDPTKAEAVIRDVSIQYQKIQDQVSRYFKAVYGDDVVFRAPETFPNVLERWMIYATTPGGEKLAEEHMQFIEKKAREQR